MTAHRDTLIRRSLRRFVLGSGPLKRRSDRLQLFGRIAVVLAFLVAPPLATVAVTATTAHLDAVAVAEAAQRSRTEAVLLEDAAAAGQSLGDYGGFASAAVPARAVWTTPGGTSREGSVLVHPGLVAGTVVPVWVDPEGDLAGAPLDPSGIPGSATAMGLLVLLGVPAAVWTLYAFLCFALDAHRDRLWAQDWAAVEPRWNSRSL